MEIKMPQTTLEELNSKIEELTKMIGEQQDKLHEKDIEIATSRAFNKECLRREEEANGFINESMEYIKNWKEVVDICDGVIPLDNSTNRDVQNHLMRFLRHQTEPQLAMWHKIASEQEERAISERNLNRGLKYHVREFANSIRF